MTSDCLRKESTEATRGGLDRSCRQCLSHAAWRAFGPDVGGRVAEGIEHARPARGGQERRPIGNDKGHGRHPRECRRRRDHAHRDTRALDPDRRGLRRDIAGDDDWQPTVGGPGEPRQKRSWVGTPVGIPANDRAEGGGVDREDVGGVAVRASDDRGLIPVVDLRHWIRSLRWKRRGVGDEALRVAPVGDVALFCHSGVKRGGKSLGVEVRPERDGRDHEQRGQESLGARETPEREERRCRKPFTPARTRAQEPPQGPSC